MATDAVSDFFAGLAKSKPCECRLCHRFRQIAGIKERGDVGEMRTLIEELQNELCDVGEDRDVMNAILKAQWPSSDQYAKRILERTFYDQFVCTRIETPRSPDA